MRLRAIAEAQADPRSYVVIEGDWGGQVYLTCPAKLVLCDEMRLHELMIELNRLAWDEEDGEGGSVYYDQFDVGDLAFGGMGGGPITGELWIHDEFREPADRDYPRTHSIDSRPDRPENLAERIREVVFGMRVSVFG